MNKMTYIQRKGNGYLETVDQFETYKEARSAIREYHQSDTTAHYYLSSRACKLMERFKMRHTYLKHEDGRIVAIRAERAEVLKHMRP